MRPKGLTAAVAIIIPSVLGNGCSVGPTRAPSTSAPTRTAAPDDGAQRLALIGLLTLKGPEREAWWALTDASGVVWRLEPASADQAAQFRQWQNGRVTVDGVRVGSVLWTPLLRVERARRLQ
jgi:hypothetical protein